VPKLVRRFKKCKGGITKSEGEFHNSKRNLGSLTPFANTPYIYIHIYVYIMYAYVYTYIIYTYIYAYIHNIYIHTIHTISLSSSILINAENCRVQYQHIK